MVVPLRKSRGGQFLNPLGSPEEMDLEEVSVGETEASCRERANSCNGWDGDLKAWEGWFWGVCAPRSE